MTYKPGIYTISNEEYHSSDGLSRSKLLTLRKSPYHFWYEYLNAGYIKKPETDALILGSAFHTMIMEPAYFLSRYAVMDKVDGRTKVGKEYIENFKQIHKNKTILSVEMFDQLLTMQSAFSQHPQANQFIDEGNIEQSLYWTDEETGLLCKCRPDIWHHNMIVDLKTTDSAAYRDFQMSAYKYGYHIQAAMMQEAFKHLFDKLMTSFVFIACEKKEPFAIATYILDEEAIAQGAAEFKRLLQRYKHCIENNEWPSYEPQLLTLPSYAKFEV